MRSPIHPFPLMARRDPFLDPPALVAIDPISDPLRCWCAACRVLDARHPGEGYQLALFPLSASQRAIAERISDRRLGIRRPRLVIAKEPA